MGYNKLHENSKKSWFIARIIWAIILISIILLVRYLLSENSEYINLSNEIDFIINVVSAIVIICSLLNAIVYPFIEYNQWRYAIDEDKIEFNEGIFYIKTIIIPIVRIQHVEINEGPINRVLKLADVIINTAGGSHKIPNLERERAKDIGLYLNNKVKKKVRILEKEIINEEEENNV